MRARVVPANEITPKSLRARDYMQPREVQVTGPSTTGYEKYIIAAYKAVVEENGKKNIEGASPDEVTKHMASRGELSALDTVIDIADLMKGLRSRRLL